MNLPDPLARACEPLFTALPLENAMNHLTGSYPGHAALVEGVLAEPALQGRSDLAAGLWLYVDDLDRSHTISQSILDATGSYWHGIMHRREGDFANSHHWMRRAASHPLIAAVPDLDPDGLVDAVSQARTDDPELVERQRREWLALFEWCAHNR